MRRLARIRVPRALLVSFLLVLPVGYVPPLEDEGPLTVRVSAGGGQAYGVATDCAGNQVGAEAGEFREIAADVAWSEARRDEGAVSVGVRGAYWKTPDAERFDSPGFIAPGPFDGFYLNPYVDFERRGWGLGAGFTMGDVPIGYDEIVGAREFIEVDVENLRVTGHLRLGAPENPQFVAAVGELQPIYVAGWFTVGVAYSLGRARLFSGCSAGWYDAGGYVQAVEWPLGDRVAIDAIGRYGASGPEDEWAAAVGLSFRLGR